MFKSKSCEYSAIFLSLIRIDEYLRYFFEGVTKYLRQKIAPWWDILS